MRQEQTYADISAPMDTVAYTPREKCAGDLSSLQYQPGHLLPMASPLPPGSARAFTAAVAATEVTACARMDGRAAAGRGRYLSRTSRLGASPGVAGAQSSRPGRTLRGD